MILSQRLLAAQGERYPATDRADRRFVLGGQSLLLVLLLFAVVLPLLAIFWRGLAGDPSQGGGLATALAFFSSAHFRWLLENSLATAATVVALVVPIAFLFAYALQRACLPAKGLWRALSLLPLLAPSMLPGIALIYLFGNQGLLRGLVADNIYGFWGIVLGQALYTFPHALMVLLGSLALADARLFDAAASLGASPWRTFRTLVWPAARQGVVAASCLVLSLCITDFGIPVVVGGHYQTLALEAYKVVMGQQQFGRGALIGLCLLLPALLSFGVDLWLRRRQRGALDGRVQPYRPSATPLRDHGLLLLVVLVCALLVGVYGTAVYSSLVRFWPYDLSLSLHNYAFADLPGGWQAYGNSLLLASSSALLGGLLIFTGTYLVEKTPQTTLTRLLRLLCFIPMAVPGLVLGLGYVFFYNLPANPLHGLYGGLPLLAVCTVAHFLTTAQLTAATALRQLDDEFEAAARALKVPLALHFLRVTGPLCLPALLDSIRYLFVSAMTTVSAAIFLYSPDSLLAAIAVLNLDDAGNVGGAAAMATLILLTSASVSLLLAGLSRGLLRRTQAWRTPTVS